MKHKSLFFLAVMLGMMLTGCEFIPDVDFEYPTVKQIDLTVIVPVHFSSLEYFDYVVHYTDNNGNLYVDTIRQGSIIVDGWSKTSSLLNTRNCYVKTFHYSSLPVLCRCDVVLLPKVARDHIASFKFITPKPCISPNVYFSNSFTPDTNPNKDLELTEIDINDMPINSFLAVYGSCFFSYCQVNFFYGGIDVISY